MQTTPSQCVLLFMCVAVGCGAPSASSQSTDDGDTSSGEQSTTGPTGPTLMPVAPTGPCLAGSDGKICRAAVGPCDVAELCNAGVCPADALVAANEECRASAGACDLAETCDGLNAACPSDVLATSVCRAAASACDAEEVCDGVSVDCPADVAAASGTTCRASAGGCDLAETCDGTAFTCPNDQLVAAATAVPECGNYLCSGSNSACPTSCANTFTHCATSSVCSAAECKSAKKVFITSTTYNGNLGGIAGADAKCQTRADAAALGGTYRAWLSLPSGNQSPASSVTFTKSTGPYVSTSRAIVADSWTDLIDGTLDTPIERTESGGLVNSIAWTASNANGTPYTFNTTIDCVGWTSSSGSTGAYTGSNGYASSAWSLNSDFTCNTLAHLYCFEQ